MIIGISFVCLCLGAGIGMFLTAILSSGKRADMEMAILLLEEDNKKVRTQLHTMLLKDMPYEHGHSDETIDLIDLGPDHDGPIRFIANPSK